MADSKLTACAENITCNISKQQLKYLVECMEHYPSLAMPTSRTREKNSIFDQKWNHISEDINKIKWGCVKTGPEWQRYWTSYKHQVRKKYLRINAGDQLNLNTVEGRVLRMLCDDEGELLDANRLIDPNAEFNSADTNDLFQPLPTLHLNCQDSMDSDSNEAEVNLATFEDKDKDGMGEVSSEEFSEHGDGDVEPVTQTVLVMDADGHSFNYVREHVWTRESSKEDVQVDSLKFHLKRQKEMHILEMSQARERHRLEMDILELKRKHMMLEYYRIRMMTNETSVVVKPVNENYMSLQHEDNAAHINVTAEGHVEKTKTKEEIKVEILQFHSKKQKEMHALETEHIKERHKLEMEILELKKKKKMLEIDKITMSNIRSGQSLVG